MFRRDQHSARSSLGGRIQILLLGLAALLISASGASAQTAPPGCPVALESANIVQHDFSFSYCELCETGRVRIVLENPFGPPGNLDFAGLVVTEDLQASGLTYVPGTTSFVGSNVAGLPPAFDPLVGGASGQLLTWDLAGLTMDSRPGGAANRARVVIEFEVRRTPIAGEEGLVGADRAIVVEAELTPSCAAPPARFTATSGEADLPLREPLPQIIKRGRNVDAGQGSGSYSDPVYAHANDDVIWRVEVRNNGATEMQDAKLDDSMVPGNFEIDYVCYSEGNATSAANGSPPGACDSVGPTTDIFDLDIGPIPAGQRARYYLVGRVTDSCTNRVNTVSGVEWGCVVESPPVGGITQTSNNVVPGDAAALRTLSVESGLDVDVSLTGINTSQPMGARGTVTIEITNNSNGTVLDPTAQGIRIRNLLPAEYVVDTTFAPTLVVDPAYGNTYPGMVDTLTWTNPQPNTVPLDTGAPVAFPLGNTELELRLTSSTVHPDFPDQLNMIRHGDVVTVTFQTVLIDPQYYDLTANLDVRTEEPASDPPGTDPTESFNITNELEIWFEEFCNPGTTHNLTFTENDVARPEDIDVDIVGTELVFILTNTGDPLPLTVALTNNGGHDADNYFAYVTFGQAMVVSSAPAGCSVTANPPVSPVWEIPVVLPLTAAVYQCDVGTLAAGATQLLDFEVVKNTAAVFDDDLTFRVDVIGEIHLSDDTPLYFPVPQARPDGVTDDVNTYSVDALWARVIGYNLFKDQVGVCSENPPAGLPDAEVQIGEECSFHVESGGWFGFETPGFTYIAVQNIQVVDEIPDGQGYISSTDPLATSTAQIQGVALNPPPQPLDDVFFDWTFNTIVPGERITEKDHWFRADVTTRLLNDPVDSRAAPNVHAAPSPNILTSTFEAVFYNQVSDAEEVYDLGPTTIGFPREVHRRVDLTVTEPLLTVTKEVCNETIYGVGAACTNFVLLADDGDAFDTYVYRITVENEAASGGFTRAPAYDVTVTSVTDPSDQLFVDPLPGDTLDNDGDALVDAADAPGEGSITDNTVLNTVPAQVIASYTHSDALLRIDAGQQVFLYYRVDPDDRVAPLEELTSTATASYDSLEGASGTQSAPLGLNGELGGARQYVSDPGEATIQIIPVEVSPKQITRTSNTPLAGVSPQPVSIGEEVEFELQALIPVAQLRSFVIRDELPAGLSCSDAPTIDLGAAPYDAAGFMPGGVFVPTCSDTEVIWDFGDQTVTQSPRDDRRFDFAVRFIARVENVIGSQDGLLIRNGGASTVTTVNYVDQAGTPVVLPIEEASVLVQEPVVVLQKAFAAATADAGDIQQVTVIATNNGTATAYNLRVLDDLTAVPLSFVGGVVGAVPPSVDVVTFGPDRPLFSWPAGFAIAPGASVSFSFDVEVGIVAEPLEVLPNTIEADWTSLPAVTTALNPSGQIGPDGSLTGMRNGALPNAADPLNDYEAQALAAMTVPPLTLDKIDVDPALLPEIGVHKPFEVLVELPEGTTQGLVVNDDLASGSVSYVLADNADFAVSYDFVGIASINGLAPDAAAFTAVPADGSRGTVVWSVGTVVTQAEDDFAAQLLTPSIRIRYSARVDNDLDTNSGSTLQNGVVTNYLNGETGALEILADATAAVVAIEPVLTATKVLTNETPGKNAGDAPAFGDTLQYVVTVVNGGNATAYDVNIVDTLPPELALSAGFTPTAAIGGTLVGGFVGNPAGAPDGPLVWGRQNGDESLDIPQGSFLDLTYQVVVRTPLLDPTLIENNVFTDWTSLTSGSVYERTGDGCPVITPPNDYCFGPAVAAGTAEPVDPPDPALKENTQATASIGEAFRYRITIPATPYPFALNDVRINDDLAASAANLRFLGVTKIQGSGAWTPVNTGTPTSLVIEDTAGGIDIPPGERIVVEITVVLEDTVTNVSGLQFTNTATYLYNWVDGDDTSQRPGTPGVTDTTPPMTIVGPDVLTLEKTGPTSMTVGAPGSFALNVHNTSTGPAFNLTVTDQLADGATGGTCDIAPSQITAQVFEADGTTPVSAALVEGVDFATTFSVAPACVLELDMLSAATAIGPDQRLLVGYEALLDLDSQEGAVLTNVAGATEWFSTDGTDPNTLADRRTYTRVLTDGTTAVLDHEDAHSFTVALPAYLFEKSVINVSTGADPGSVAMPGDTLRYRLRIENQSDRPLNDFSVFDELGRLNAAVVFQPGSLALVTVPAGADVSNTSATGGADGTGVIDVRNLNLPGLNDSAIIEFEILLAPVIANGTAVTNQAQLLVGGNAFADSDDPNVNGAADPYVAGDEDPTQVLIQSAPYFRVQKSSAYITGDPAVLLAGETLRYTITVKNIGTEDAVDAFLRDAVPVNTQYVAGSTTLNGVVVPDGPAGSSPLSGGILVSAPEDPTPGAMRADASVTPGNVATLVFDVVVDPDAIDGTVISNQAFVSAILGGVSDQPSDDPSTALPDDPTRDVVGNAPLLFAPKSAVLETDNGTVGIVDPGDVLRYTISVYNSGAVPATAVTLQDVVPANTTYVADSLTLNTIPVGAPGATVSPLIAGIPISSTDLTPPLPAAGAGTVSPGAVAVVEFLLRVDDLVPSGTIISNQARVGSVELPDLLTDGDGNPATGPEPTLVVVGDGQQLAITKQVTVVGGGAALAGSELEYLVSVVNIASVPASTVVITDDLDLPVAGQLAYVALSATLNGSPVGVTVVGSLITADYSTTYGPLQPGESAVLRFRAVLDPGLAQGTTVTNTGVVTWNSPVQTAMASVSIDEGGMPGVGILNGTLWHDADFDRSVGVTERLLDGWTVELRRNGATLQTTSSDASGNFRMSGLVPNDVSGDQYELFFRAPGAGAGAGALGFADSAFTNGPQQISDILVASGSNLQGLNLPIDPNGVIYDSVQRVPVAGATVNLLGAGTGIALPSACLDDPNQQGQVTLADGYYKFDLNFSDASCPSGGSYLVAVTPPATGYVAGTSQIIPPTSDGSTAPLSVPSCPAGPNDAIPATAQFCEAQTSEFAPPPSVPPRTQGTVYYLNLSLDSSQTPGSSQIFNNHIPLDPVLDGAVAITKTTPVVNVSRGQLVPYEITFSNELGVDFPDLSLVDRYPAGFRYVDGSAQVDGVEMEPTVNGRELMWTDLGIGASSTRRVVLLLAVGAGVNDGEYVNRAYAISSFNGTALSGEATATVRVVPDPTFDCTDVLGKVFDDRNRNGTQDRGEDGLQGVKLVTARGLVATTDQYGRFHITCAVVPRDGRGSNFVLKLDDRSLPTGYRMSTRQTQVKRATRGKALRFDYGASIHRVVALDMADAVFEPGSTQMRLQWKPRLGMLVDELKKAPALLRLSYVADVEDEGLVERRLEAVKREIRKAWDDLDDAYELTIETEIFWRRGAPTNGPAAMRQDREERFAPEPALAATRTLPSVSAGPPVVEAQPNENVERHLPSDEAFTQWSQDPALLETQAGDRLQEREVVTEDVETIKLTDVVPPVRFESGAANIPPSYIAKLREVLQDMRGLRNVRLHLIGHSDDQPLSGPLAGRYGDNAGLSRERAGEVAEFIQTALALPPEAISFEWAGDTQPVSSNATEAGRAMNRRVEVEVWYDEVEERLATEEFVVPEDIKRVKICRMETVCKLRYREGHAHRARVKNLVAPLNFGEETVGVSPDFVRQIKQALYNLRDKQNVTVKFVGFTDDLPLSGRAERIYGTHLALSKARARRVALAVKDALALPSAGIASDGRGATRPLASNDTLRGRALNRRIEVEFWHDDPLQELPDEPQLCPDASGAELVTKVYDPPWGRLDSLPIDDGDVEIPAGYLERLRRALADVEAESNVRLRFVGYTGNERLDRRMALVYGDDIGLSTARARRAMNTVRQDLGLEPEQAEHEGRGYIHSDDVVNGGFVQGDRSYVVVQVVYDELALIDDNEGIEVTPITRELRAKDPLELNLMRITVDGKPVDDPGRSSADIQRCTDVALERADVQFRFDDLESQVRLSVTVDPGTVPVRLPLAGASDASVETAEDDETVETVETIEIDVPASSPATPVRFKMYSNYSHFIERSEVRIYAQDQSLRATPLAVVEVAPNGVATWLPEPESFPSPMRVLKFVLRVYDAEGHFDQTAPQQLWMVHADGSSSDSAVASVTPHPPRGQDPLLAGYGESEPVARNIPLDNAGTVRVQGSGVPENHEVWLAGAPVPVDENGNFVAEALVPTGLHTVEVAVLDEAGNGELFLRDLDLEQSDWFYVGIADLTLSAHESSGRIDALQGKNSRYDNDSFADGRLAFYVTGKFAEDWKLTASADTREDEVTDLFSNFLDKSPDSLFRRIDPDYHYPTFGDDSTVEETAPTSGKMYLKLSKDENHALWGNFKIGYLDNELAQVDRGLYGANLHYQSLATTEFGEQRVMLDGFGAQPGTVGSREQFRGTGGSLYFLKRQDILQGSERVRVEVRDKDSGLVTGVVYLQPTLDYDIDYLQGRILLAEPVDSTVADGLLVRSQGLSGNEAWLVVQYEYSPDFDEIDSMTFGGTGQVWLNDHVKVGVTASRDDEGENSTLYAGDLTFRKSTESWIKLQAGRTEGLVQGSLSSNDGGFQFVGSGGLLLEGQKANGYRADLSVGIGDFLPGARGRFAVYGQRLEAGYSAPGLNTLTDTDNYGGILEVPLTDELHLNAKADREEQKNALTTTAAEVDVSYALSDRWSVSGGVRHERREDDAPVVVSTQEEGDRTDGAVQVTYDSLGKWRGYGFGQATVAKSGNREKNNRGGVGGAYQVNDKLVVDGEVSHGDLGPAVKVGTSYQQSEDTHRYFSYALENERGVNGVSARRGTLISGMRTRLADSGSVYMEDRYQHTDSSNGLARSMGITLAPAENWSVGANWELGTLIDRQTDAETKRRAGGGSVGYGTDDLRLSSGIEYIYDKTEQPDGSWSNRTTWLFRNSLKYQVTPSGRVIGKFNHSFSDSSLGQFYDGGYTEGILGLAYRPVKHDRLNVLAKYTYFYNVPTTDQVILQDTPVEFIQKSHIAAIDVSYDLTADLTVGAKYAFRRGEVSLDRENKKFFSNDAHLYILRTDWRFLKNWEGSLEGRSLDLPDINERRSGALFTLYRYFGEHFKVGIGYNFTDFSDDLTDLSYDDHGIFFNLIGTL